MGRERSIKENTNMKLIGSVAEKVSVDDKEEIQNNIYLIKKITEKENYNSGLMRVLFHFWAKYMPQHQQSIKCGGCRQAVLRFWKQVNNEWENNGAKTK